MVHQLLSNLLGDLQEQPVSRADDIGLVDTEEKKRVENLNYALGCLDLAGDLEIPVAVECFELRQCSARAAGRRTRSHSYRRSIAARKRRNAANMIGMLMGNQHSVYVARISPEAAEALLDRLERQSAVNEHERLRRLDEKRVAATAATERCET